MKAFSASLWQLNISFVYKITFEAFHKAQFCNSFPLSPRAPWNKCMTPCLYFFVIINTQSVMVEIFTIRIMMISCGFLENECMRQKCSESSRYLTHRDPSRQSHLFGNVKGWKCLSVKVLKREIHSVIIGQFESYLTLQTHTSQYIPQFD